MDYSLRDIAVGLLAWYREMGVDALLADEPVNWLERGAVAPGEKLRAQLQSGSSAAASDPTPPPVASSERAAAPPPRPAPAAGPQAPALRSFSVHAPDAAESVARTAAGAASSMAELQRAIDAFDGCGLKATASRSCVYRGAERARLMIVGEAPGRDEDLEGRPFVGRAGQLLDRMLAAIGLGESDVHITNIVYWRPPGNRTPTPHEAQVCRPFLERQLELVRPELVMPLGGPAAKHLLDVTDGIMRVRGKWRDVVIGSHRVRALPSLHPAYLLRTPAAKRLTWQDLLAIKAALAGD